MENTNIIAVEAENSVDLLSLSALEIVKLLNEEQDLNKHAPMKKALEEVLKNENKEHMIQAVAEFVKEYGQDTNAFWNRFITDPFAPRFSMVEDTEAEERYSLKEGQKRISFLKVDAKYQEENHGQTMAQAKNYCRMLARFTDNIYRKVCGELSAGCDKKQAVIRVTFHGAKEDYKKDVDFSATTSKAMKAQMQAIVDTILPETHSVLVRDADLSFVLKVAQKASLDNGAVKTGKEVLILNAIMKAVDMVKNERTYVVESAAECHKEKKAKKSDRTEAQEEKTSKIPDREHETKAKDEATGK